MADLENEAPNLDNLDAKGIGELRDRMSNGEDVSKPAEKPVKEAAEASPAADADVEDDTGASDEPIGEKPAKTKQENVPFPRFDNERNRRKEAEAKYEKLQADNAKIMEQFTALMQQRQEPRPAAEAPPAPPDIDLDPLGAIKQVVTDFNAFKNETVQERTQRVEQQQRQQQIDGALNFAREQFAADAKADPTVQKAYETLLESFAQEQKAYGIPDNQIAARLADIEQQHIFYALRQKIPLGEYVKNIAKTRGWNPNAQAALVPQAEAEPTAQEVNASIRQSAASLSNTGGAPARTGAPTPQTLLDMSPAQYAKYREAHSVGEAFGWRG